MTLNHNWDLGRALDMCDVAKDTGGSHVKFQTWFRKDWLDLGEPFTKDQWRILFDYCDRISIPWFSTPFDLEAMDFLKECGMTIWKIPSGMATNERFVKAVVKMEPEHVILSTGMCDIAEAWKSLGWLFSIEKVDLLHCVTGYPTKYEEMNLAVLKTAPFTGISDHTPGVEIPIAATALGAKVIEKHFTLDKGLPGPDHAASLEPQEFKQMVRYIENIRKAMGDGIKRPTESELEIRDRIRRRMELP